ncbi:FG-GAP repeat protein [Streptomyces asiaticus]|uniref:FG-GAP repeat protein n=1 Tax=Streptomyces asiaticus TaxID=114695 RepID=UPI003F66CDD7
MLLFLGGPDGPTGKGTQQFDQRDVGSAPGKDHDFGAAARLADLNGDHMADLTVSTPGFDDVRSSAWLLPGSPDGLSTEGVAQLRETSFADTKDRLTRSPLRQLPPRPRGAPHRDRRGQPEGARRQLKSLPWKDVLAQPRRRSPPDGSEPHLNAGNLAIVGDCRHACLTQVSQR